MNFSTKAHLFFGVNIEIPKGVEWETLDDDDKGSIKMIAYGSDGDSMYAVAIAESVTTVELDSIATPVRSSFGFNWTHTVEGFCEKHGLTGDVPAWRLAVERF